MNKLSDNSRGALLMMSSQAAFTINDTAMKLLSDEMPLMQGLFLRGIGTVVALAAIGTYLGVLRFDLPRRDWGLIVLRSLGEIGGAYFFLTALFNMPQANVTAIFQALPLAITLAGALFLGEPVGWRRLTAIVIGFGGVMLIVRPGTDGFNSYAFYALASVASVVVRDLATRRLSAQVPSFTVALSAGIAVTLFSGFGSLFQTCAMPSTAGAVQLFLATAFVVVGYLVSVAAMRVGDLGFVAPFRYVGLIWAIVLGYIAFGEWPDTMTFIGSAVIVATGIFTLLRERQVVRSAAVLPRNP